MIGNRPVKRRSYSVQVKHAIPKKSSAVPWEHANPNPILHASEKRKAAIIARRGIRQDPWFGARSGGYQEGKSACAFSHWYAVVFHYVEYGVRRTVDEMLGVK